jgi:hypothetical protein
MLERETFEWPLEPGEPRFRRVRRSNEYGEDPSEVTGENVCEELVPYDSRFMPAQAQHVHGPMTAHREWLESPRHERDVKQLSQSADPPLSTVREQTQFDPFHSQFLNPGADLIGKAVRVVVLQRGVHVEQQAANTEALQVQRLKLQDAVEIDVR